MRQHHNIDIGSQQLLVSIESGEVMIRLHANAWLDRCDQVFGLHFLRTPAALDGDARVTRHELGIAQMPERLLEMVFEHIRHPDQFHVFVAGEQIDHRLRAASAATHQAGLQPVAAGSPRRDGPKQRKSRRARAQQGRLFQEISAGNAIRVLHDSTVSHAATGRFAVD